MKGSNVGYAVVAACAAGAAAIAYGALFPPYVVTQRGPFEPKGLSQVALGKEPTGIPAEFGSGNLWIDETEQPSYFFIEGPKPLVPVAQVGNESDSTQATIVEVRAGQEWSRVDLFGGFKEAGQFAAKISRSYPPGAEPLARIASPSGVSDVRLRGVAPTVELFDFSREVSSSALSQGSIVGAAYRPRRRPGSPEPTVGTVLRFDLPSKQGVAWRLEGMQLIPAYGKPGYRSGSRIGYEVIPGSAQMDEISAPFADTWPMVQLKGKLVRQEVQEDLVDFGAVSLTAIGGDAFAIPSTPVTRRLGDGSRIVLTPAKVPKSAPDPKTERGSPKLHLRLSVPGLGELLPSNGGFPVSRVDFRSAEEQTHLSARPSENGAGDLTLFLSRPWSAGRPLRLWVRRIQSETSEPFELRLKVVPVGWPAYHVSSRVGEVIFRAEPKHLMLLERGRRNGP